MSEAGPSELITSITPPISFDPDNKLVAYVYPIPGSGDPVIPDLRSVKLAGDYEVSRHQDDEVLARRHLAVVAEPIPVPAYIPGGSEVTRYQKAPGYLVHPWVSAASIVISALVVNGPPAVAWVHAKIEQADYKPTPPRTKTIEVPGKTITISERVASPDRVGSVVVNISAIDLFHNEVVADEAEGDVVTAIDEHANSSDEYYSEGEDSSIGVPSPGNEQIDAKRDKAVEKVLAQTFGDKLPAPVHETGTEHVISEKLKSRLELLARQDGFPNLISAVMKVDENEIVKGPLESYIERDFVAERGVNVSATIQEPGHETTKIKHIKGKDDPPPGPTGWNPWFVPILPVRRRELVTDTSEEGRFALLPGPSVVPWPRILKEDGEHVLVRVLKEAELPGGKLAPNLWAYTRKYLHLFREQRIPLIMRADFQAGDGTDKSIYTLFVDHTPNDEELAMLYEQMPMFAAVQGGSLADKLTIAIHPSSQAGRSPDRPWRIGPSIDKQYGERTLGVCTPILGIAEIHKVTDDIAGLREALSDFRESPEITIDHEVPGHGSAIVNGRLGVLRAFAWGIRHARVPDRGPWRHDFATVSATLEHLVDTDDLVALERQLDKLEFDISYVDEEDRMQNTRVGARNPLIRRSKDATIVGYDATQYSAESFLENQAETVAAGVSGEVVPFTEAGVDAPYPPDPQASYTTGYRPDAAALEAATKIIGGITDTWPIEFKRIPEVRIALSPPEEDPVIGELVAMARGIRFPRAGNMLAILAGQAKHEGHSRNTKQA